MLCSHMLGQMSGLVEGSRAVIASVLLGSFMTALYVFLVGPPFIGGICATTIMTDQCRGRVPVLILDGREKVLPTQHATN